MLDDTTMHDLAERFAMKAVREEYWRRWNNGLPCNFDYTITYGRAYREATHAYAQSNAIEAGRTEAPDT